MYQRSFSKYSFTPSSISLVVVFITPRSSGGMHAPHTKRMLQTPNIIYHRSIVNTRLDPRSYSSINQLRLFQEKFGKTFLSCIFLSVFAVVVGFACPVRTRYVWHEMYRTSTRPPWCSHRASLKKQPGTFFAWPGRFRKDLGPFRRRGQHYE